MNFEIKQLFDLSHTQAADYLSAFRYPWEALEGIKQMILDLGEKITRRRVRTARRGRLGAQDGEDIPERLSGNTVHYRPGD